VRQLATTRSIAALSVGLILCIQPALAGSEAPVAAQTVEQPPAPKRFWPRKSDWRGAARNAFCDPGTWAPAGAAAVIAVGGWDRELSDWAVTHTPVFGSVENASQWSDWLRAASDVGMIATALSVHADEHPWRLRTKTLLVEETGAIATTSLTALLKNATDRERPDGSDRESFPSGHASRAFAYAAASRRNLDATRLSRGWRIGLSAGLETLAIGTGMARIEAQKHYPTDVLVGAALGNCVSLLLHDAFLGTTGQALATVNVDPHRPSFTVSFVF
jgi:membrane-associated phospholipid phosphatase